MQTGPATQNVLVTMTESYQTIKRKRICPDDVTEEETKDNMEEDENMEDAEETKEDEAPVGADTPDEAPSSCASGTGTASSSLTNIDTTQAAIGQDQPVLSGTGTATRSVNYAPNTGFGTKAIEWDFPDEPDSTYTFTEDTPIEEIDFGVDETIGTYPIFPDPEDPFFTEPIETVQPPPPPPDPVIEEVPPPDPIFQEDPEPLPPPPVIEDPVTDAPPIITDTPYVEDPAFVQDPPPVELEPEPLPVVVPPPPPTQANVLAQTPFSGTGQMNRATTLSQAVSSVTNQGVNNNWMPWEGSQWNGIPLQSPETKTKSQLCSFLRPTGSKYIIKGLKGLYDEKKPFAVETAPTPGEIDVWNIEVIRHFRRLLGNPNPVDNDPRLYLESRWADERKYTTQWDSKYPGGNLDDPAGPCYGGINIHCGAGFFPSSADRAPYIAAEPYYNNWQSYPQLQLYNERFARAEGIAEISADLPWSIKLAVVIAQWICSEGLTGHAGPFVHPERARRWFGCSWWWPDATQPRMAFRGKWR